MSVWEFQITGLEITGHDGYGWPITRLVDLTMTVKEYNILKLYRNVWKEAESQFPTCCAFNIKSVERIDKKNNKDYGFQDDPTRLTYKLTPPQREELQEIKGEILLKVMGNSKPHNFLLLFASDDSMQYITDDIAWFKGHSGIFTHHAAQTAIKALQKFYSRISPDELAILNSDKIALSQSDLEAVRKYRLGTSAVI